MDSEDQTNTEKHLSLCIRLMEYPNANKSCCYLALCWLWANALAVLIWFLFFRHRHKIFSATPLFVTLCSLAGCLIIKGVQNISIWQRPELTYCKVNWKPVECAMEIRGWHQLFAASPKEVNLCRFFCFHPLSCYQGPRYSSSRRKYSGDGRTSPSLSQICISSPSVKVVWMLVDHWYWAVKSALWIWQDHFFYRFSLALLRTNPPKCFASFCSFMVFQRNMRIHRIAIMAPHGLYLVIYWWFRSKHMWKGPDESSCKFLPVL